MKDFGQAYFTASGKKIPAKTAKDNNCHCKYKKCKDVTQGK